MEVFKNRLQQLASTSPELLGSKTSTEEIHLKILLASSGARADSAAGLASVRVGYADLDLHRASDSRLLYKRLTSAAQEVCKSLDISSEPIHTQLKAAHEDCVQHAIAGAVARINQPDFTIYAQTKLAPSSSQYALLSKK